MNSHHAGHDPAPPPLPLCVTPRLPVPSPIAHAGGNSALSVILVVHPPLAMLFALTTCSASLPAINNEPTDVSNGSRSSVMKGLKEILKL